MEAHLAQFTSHFRRVRAIKLEQFDHPPQDEHDRSIWSKWVHDKPWDPAVDRYTAKKKTFVASVFLSHLGLFDEILARDSDFADLDKPYLILEDDVVLHNDFASKFSAALKFVPDE